MKKAMNEQRFIDTKTGVMALGDKEAHLIVKFHLINLSIFLKQIYNDLLN
ncbi:hypothetical protein [Campylobacter hyointestinalis]|nr:hypothetical protein [Campylobacter hyointestinalis]